MFTLIIAIVAVAIIVGILWATLYHGGSDTMTKGKQQAEVAKSLNDLGQITAALYQFHADTGSNATSLDDLVPKYLSSIPQGWGVEVPSQVAFESTQLLTGSESQKLDSCTQINQKLGITSVPPSCADIDSSFTGCCVVPDSNPA
jgi:Tfp pilus assembly protein PilE